MRAGEVDRVCRAAVARALVVVCAIAAGSNVAGQSASEQLAQLFADEWEFRLQEDPLFATFVGDVRYNDRLPDVTAAAQDRNAGAQRGFLARLAEIDAQELSPPERINAAIFAQLKKVEIAEHQFGSYLIPITSRSGFHVEFPELPKHVPLRTTKDYENYVARLAAFRIYARQHADLMREGIRRGMVLPAVVLEGFEQPLVAIIVAQAADSPLFQPFAEFPNAVPAAERGRLREAGEEAISGSVVPGYRDFLEFMRREYVPAARGEIGASALPKGREFYRHRVRRFTTLDLTPEQIHETGQSEVRRIDQEMRAVIQKTGFKGDFPAFVDFLRTDPRFYVERPEQLLKEVSLVLKRMDGELPKLFGRLPRMPYGIREIPSYIAPRTTTAYYSPPSGDGTRAGYYYVNTYDLKSRPLYEIEALSLHEAVPGHHLQIALQQELEGLPDFRRFADFTAFVEGWGLYAERLGLECGFYRDPYSDFGRLSYEMWRACRLVVDSGMHYLGWSREQAIRFMAEHTALTIHNITTEVDRYISWPGQAVAYKTGELKFRELRRRAEEKLGDRFDVRQFHDVVLGSGAVPLSLLEENVERYTREAAQ